MIFEEWRADRRRPTGFPRRPADRSPIGMVNKADLGPMGNIAFDALRDLRFRSMIIRLDGDLAGEFAARLAIDGVGIGQSNRTQRLIRSC